MHTLLLAHDDVRAIVAHIGLNRLMDEMIAELTAALAAYDATRYEVPARGGFEYEAPQIGLIEWMPAIEAGRVATVKVVGYHPANPSSRALPTILSTAFVFEVGSGHLTAMIDGTLPTAMRTGAASAIASRILARRDSRVLGLIGCGAQAVTQLHALARLFPIAKVYLHDIDIRAVTTLRQRANTFGLDPAIEFRSASPEDVLGASDIVCTQTSVAIGGGPVVRDGLTRPHLHINAVGSDFPGKMELPRALLERSFVCPDFRPQALREGECQALNPAGIGPELHELVKRPDAFRDYRDRITVFDSTGWALEDHVAVGILVKHARSLRLGKNVQIETLSADPTNPYGGVLQPSGSAVAAASAR